MGLLDKSLRISNYKRHSAIRAAFQTRIAHLDELLAAVERRQEKESGKLLDGLAKMFGDERQILVELLEEVGA